MGALTEERRRHQMVERDIAGRGLSDARVLRAMRSVPRELFVPASMRDEAYDDRPLPIGHGQTISQPYIVALMAEALQLQGGEHVLEIGTGSGYAAAVLAQLGARVDSVECIEELAAEAGQRLAKLGLTQVHVHLGDGSLGWPHDAPYDAIAVAAGGPAPPPALLAQLAPGGRLLMPVGNRFGWQKLMRVTRTGIDPQEDRTESLCTVAFVPLRGAQGWH